MKYAVPFIFFFLFVTEFSFTLSAQEPKPSGLFKSHILTPSGLFTSGIEGPAVDKSGIIYAVNFSHQGTIGCVNPEGTAGLFVELPKGSIGNGIRFDSRGNMLVADYTGHNILKIDMATREISVFAHHSEMTQPNDIAIVSKDRIYASDPDFKKNKGRIWRIENNKVVLLDSLKGATNGIDISPDDKILYVNASPKVWAYDLTVQGDLKNKRLLIEFPDFVMDGMRCDVNGNLYIARFGKGTVVKVSPAGKVLEEVQLSGKRPTNVAFGGVDGCTVYVTLQDKGNIEFFRVDEPGREWKMQMK
ncbi:MAG: SMP-30/gluconolactonase/LRE family protein [Bacteroidetes bacterium]|nr:MAG: SMP-30/gluconolactonase/LRE family protein [Bacteroidota bacterium]